VDKLGTFTKLQIVTVGRSHAGAFFSQSKVKVLAALLTTRQTRVKDNRLIDIPSMVCSKDTMS
jgi:hypothetical protein